jgi:hypothetical protein
MPRIYSFERFKAQRELEQELKREGKTPTKNQMILKKILQLSEERRKLPPKDGIDLDR